MDFSEAESEAFTNAIMALAAAFNREADQATFQAYRWGTEGMSVATIQRACAAAIRTSKFMPPPSELRELGGEISPKSVGLLAWESFCQGVRKHGGNMSVDFDDKTINAVVRSLGGWQEVTLLGGDEFSKWLRQRFLDAYGKLNGMKLGGDFTKPLLGELDANNGFGKKPEPIRIECLSTEPLRPRLADETHRQPAALGVAEALLLNGVNE